MENWIHLQRQTTGLDMQQMGPNASTPNTYNKLCVTEAPRKKNPKDKSYLIWSHFMVNFLNSDFSCPYITTLRKRGKKKLHRRKTLSFATYRFPDTYWVQN